MRKIDVPFRTPRFTYKNVRKIDVKSGRRFSRHVRPSSKRRVEIHGLSTFSSLQRAVQTTSSGIRLAPLYFVLDCRAIQKQVVSKTYDYDQEYCCLQNIPTEKNSRQHDFLDQCIRHRSSDQGFPDFRIIHAYIQENRSAFEFITAKGLSHSAAVEETLIRYVSLEKWVFIDYHVACWRPLVLIRPWKHLKACQANEAAWRTDDNHAWNCEVCSRASHSRALILAANRTNWLSICSSFERANGFSALSCTSVVYRLAQLIGDNGKSESSQTEMRPIIYSRTTLRGGRPFRISDEWRNTGQGMIAFFQLKEIKVWLYGMALIHDWYICL